MLYLDCSAGISGDMFVGALIDLGASKDRIVDSLSHIAKIKISRVSKKGVPATRFKVSFPEKKANYMDLVEKVKSIKLSRKAQNVALSILRKLAEAEAKAHGVPLKDVHLHEAADSVVDAVSSAIALEDLGLLDSPFVSSTVSVGRLAQAAFEIVRKYQIPVKYVSEDEITTPTGAAILAALVADYTDEQSLEGSEGFGAGERDFSYPNVLRAVVGEPLFMLESNIDDVSPEVISFAQERLMVEGALDVHVMPCVMKKGRCGFLVRVLTSNPPYHAKILMEETGTLGVRETPILKRYTSKRMIGERQITILGRKEKVRVKESEYGFKPEFDDVKKLTLKYKVPAREINEKISQVVRKRPPS